MRVVALDPGTRRAGLAIVEDGAVIYAVDLLTSRADVVSMIAEVAGALDAVLGPDRPVDAALVVEWPRKYKTLRVAHDDVDGLREVGAAVARWGWTGRVTRVAPAAWKGNVPKRIHHRRIYRDLRSSERARVVWETLGPDARDAIGLARWGWARLAATDSTG